MALIGGIEVIGRANLAPMMASFAAGARTIDAWSAKVGGGVDKAFAKLASGAGSGKILRGLAGSLDAIGKATAVTRTALAVGDVYRATRWAEVGFNRLRLSFAGSGEKADALRAKTDALSSGLARAGAASGRLRFAAFATEVGAFGVKLGVVATRDLAAFATASGRVAAGTLGLASGFIRAGTSLVGIVPNAGRAAAALYKAGDASQGAARRTVELYTAWYYAKRSAGGALMLTGALGTLIRSSFTATRGLVGFGTALAGIAWRTAVAGASTFIGVVGRVSSSILSLTTRVGTIAGVGAVIAGALGVKAAAGAAHLEEAYNKTEVKFGQYAGTVLKASAAMRDAYATNERQFIDGADAIGAMLKGVGYSQKDAAALGVSFTKLAADANAALDPLGGFEQSLQKIRSGLAGESEPLKEWGVLIDEGAVKAYAYANGIAKANSELTNSQKVQARVALIQKGLADEMGGLAREAAGTAAQINEFWGRLDALSNTIGQTLAPALGSLLTEANTGIYALTEAWKTNREAILGWFGVSGAALSGAGDGVGLLTQGVIKLAESWGHVTAAIDQSMSALSAGQSTVAGWIASWAKGQLKNAEMFLGGKAKDDRIQFLKILIEEETRVAGEAKKAGDQWAKSAEERIAAIPKVGEAIREQFFKAQEGIKGMRQEAEAATKIGATGTPTAGPAVPKKGAKRDPYAPALEFGSKEAATAVLRAQFGGDAQAAEAEKRTAANTAETNRLLRDQLRRNADQSGFPLGVWSIA